MAVQYTAGVSVTTATSPGISAAAYQTITNVSEIDNLEGPAYQVGGSISNGVLIGGDLNLMPPTDALPRGGIGITTIAGVAFSGVEVHVGVGNTKTWEKSKINIFDVAKDVYGKVMGW